MSTPLKPLSELEKRIDDNGKIIYKYTFPKNTKGYDIYPPAPNAEQVMRYAKAIEATPEIYDIFQKMDKWGLPGADELDRLEAFRDMWLKQNGMDHLCLNGFFGANMIFRRMAWGQMDGLDDPRAMAFLKEDEPRNTIDSYGGPVKHAVSGVESRIDESMWLANYIRHRCDYWPHMQEDFRHRGEEDWPFPTLPLTAAFWVGEYGPKYGVINRSIRTTADNVALEEWSMGRVPALDCKETWVLVNNRPYVMASHIKENLDV
jgi:hypothetical protein